MQQESIVETPQPQITPTLTPDQAPTQPLMTQCPICQQQIVEYSNPYPFCGGELEWGKADEGI